MRLGTVEMEWSKGSWLAMVRYRVGLFLVGSEATLALTGGSGGVSVRGSADAYGAYNTYPLLGVSG